MPRRSPLSKDEKAIALRIREARIRVDLTAVAFAKRLGVDSSKLASYEHARTPLPYLVAHRICEIANINQSWLATGKSLLKDFAPVASGINTAVPEKASFIEVYSKLLEPLLNTRISLLRELNGRETSPFLDSINHEMPPLGCSVETAIIQHLARAKITMHIAALPAELQRPFYDNMDADYDRFCYSPKRQHIVDNRSEDGAQRLKENAKEEAERMRLFVAEKLAS